MSHPICETPRPWDILWCHFPFAENQGIPGPKARPVLVYEVLMNSKIGISVRVLYGSSRYKTLSENVIPVMNLGDVKSCGLDRSTVFRLDRMLLLPWVAEFFIPNPSVGRIVIGSFTNDMRARVLENLKAPQINL